MILKLNNVSVTYQRCLLDEKNASRVYDNKKYKQNKFKTSSFYIETRPLLCYLNTASLTHTLPHLHIQMPQVFLMVEQQDSHIL